MDSLAEALRRVRRRLFLQRWLDLAVAALLGWAATLFAWVLATRLFPVLGNPRPVGLVLLGIGVLAASSISVWRRPSMLRAALETDRRLGLRERFTSSWQLAALDGPMVQAVHADARRHLGNLDVRRDFLLRLPRHAPVLVAALLVLGLAFAFLPEFDLLHYRQKQVAQKALREKLAAQVQRLEFAAKPLQKPELERNPALAALGEQVERVAMSLEKQEITDKQAVARITKMAEEIQKLRENIETQNQTPKMEGDTSKLDMTRALANDLKQGDFAGAEAKAAALRKEIENKLKDGSLSKEEKAALAKELEQLAKMLGGKEANPALAKALAEAAEGLSADNLAQAMAGLKDMDLAFGDLKSAMDQLAALDAASAGLLAGMGKEKGWGRPLIGGEWEPEDSDAEGPGMGKKGGHGKGGKTGDLPSPLEGFNPTVLPGQLNKGQILAGILQKGAPEKDAKPTLEYIEGELTQVKQEAEQALTKEEIPPGSKEFVRQYFGTLEPEKK